MPTGKNTKQITAVITVDEYNRIQTEVNTLRRRGKKSTMSQYVAEALRAHFDYVDHWRANGNK